MFYFEYLFVFQAKFEVKELTKNSTIIKCEGIGLKAADNSWDTESLELPFSMCSKLPLRKTVQEIPCIVFMTVTWLHRRQNSCLWFNQQQNKNKDWLYHCTRNPYSLYHCTRIPYPLFIIWTLTKWNRKV